MTGIPTKRPDTPCPKGAGAPDSAEIEVTPEMIEAGTSRLWELEGVVDSARLVAAVYQAMAAQDAVWFKRQGDVGTAILNPSKAGEVNG